MAVQSAIALDVAGRIGRGHSFTAEHAGHTDLLAFTRRAVVFSHLVTQLRQQRIVGRLGQVIHIDLVRLALTHPRIEIAALAANAKAGQTMAQIWPHFAPYPNLPRLVKADAIDFATIDAVFGCLPHAASGLDLALALRERGQRVLLIEDLTTDGGSKLSFVDAIRETGATCAHTAVIFYYGIFPDTEAKLGAHGVKLHHLCTWWDVLAEARAQGSFDEETLAGVEEFLNDPRAWQAARKG